MNKAPTNNGLILSTTNCSPRQLTSVLVTAIALAAFALSRSACGVTPAPDGGYPNGNTAEGEDALFSLTTGRDSTAVGFEALYSITTSEGDTAIGYQALAFNTTGYFNTATGYGALFLNTVGRFNTATGVRSLGENTGGSANTATGLGALGSNQTGSDNTADGLDALYNNLDGHDNTANGYWALENNYSGNYNTANGNNALGLNYSGNNNTGNGVEALKLNDAGSNNTANSAAALYNNNANYNTADGQGSLYGNTTGHNNTADGQNALQNNTTGSNNVALGSNAGKNLTTGDNNIDIFNRGVAGDANTIRIGKQGTQTQTYVAGIFGSTVAGGVSVIIDNTGHLGTATSSQRFKTQIKPMDKSSEAILALNPVTFRYKKELDPQAIPQFGLVAEQVAKVNPDLVARDDQGKPYTVRHEAVNAVLLNEFLKEHRKVSTLEATITPQQKQIEALAAGLQKVNEKVALQKVAPRIVANQH